MAKYINYIGRANKKHDKQYDKQVVIGKVSGLLRIRGNEQGTAYGYIQ
jgi:hypothetical protein